MSDLFSENRDALVLENRGQKIFCTVHRPQLPLDLAERKSPAVLICHGLGGNKCGKYRALVDLAVELVKKGVTVLRFDFRGAGDSEGCFEETTVEGMLEDVSVCFNFLLTDLTVDPSRIGIMGRSFGGFVAALAASKIELVKSLVMWSPVYPSVKWKEAWKKMVDSSSLEIATQVAQFLPHLSTGPNVQFLEEFFQIAFKQVLNQLQSIPILHIQGLKDSVVPMDQAEAYHNDLKDCQIVDYLELPESDHDYKPRQEREQAIAKTTDWFLHTL